MPMMTSRVTAKISVALLLGLASFASAAPEQHDFPAVANITHNSQGEGHRAQSKWQLCLVGSRNCLSLDRHQARPCLLAPNQCEGDAGKLERLELTH
jgi:hypothetical protein